MQWENKDFIKKIKKSDQIILNANYIFFDASLWGDAHILLKELDVQYHLIGLNVFGERELTPTLIDLNSISNEKKLEIWSLIGSYSQTSGFSGFDQMSMFQTYIYSDRRVEIFKDFLADFMVYRYKSNNYLFRYYDPRVSIHFSNIYSKLNDEMYLKYRDFIKKWVVSINHQYYEVGLLKSEISDIGFDELDGINSIIRNELTQKYDEFGEEVFNSSFKNINELINIAYEKSIREKNNGY